VRVQHPRLLWVGWSCLVFLGATARAGPIEAARLVAPDAALYVEITRPADVLDRVRGDRVQALLALSPEYRKAIEGNQYRQFRGVVDLMAARLETTWPEAFATLTGGGLMLAAEGPKADRFLLVATPTDPAFLLKAHATLIDLARRDAAGKGNPDPAREVRHGDTTLFLAGGKGEAHAIFGGVLVMAGSRETLEAAINRAEAQAPSIADDATWKARRDDAGAKATAWAFARLDRLREMDPATYGGDARVVPPNQQFLFGPWIEAIRKAPWASSALTWEEGRLSAVVTLPDPPGGYSKPLQAFLPPQGAAAPVPLLPPRMIASVGLWRDLSAIWDVRGEIFPPEVVENLAKLDTTAGTFFGGRDFGVGVLGALGSDWRLVIAGQDDTDLNPVPAVKVPAFALVVGLKPDDEEFGQRLRVAFQSFIGLANLGAAQQKAPPLEMGSETVEGVTIATARFMPPRAGKAPAVPVHTRHNFSPSSARVGDTFILSSTAVLARDLVLALKGKGPSAADPTDATLLAKADGAELAKLLEADRATIVAQNILEKGIDKAKAEAELHVLTALLRTLNRASLSTTDAGDSVRVRLEFQLGGPSPE